MENKSIFTEILNLSREISPTLSNLIEKSIDFVPYIGSILQNAKMHRLSKRLLKHEEKLNIIAYLVTESNLSQSFINERVFPIVLSDLIEEHEDAKINLILNGFINVFIDNQSKESIILNYFDTLRSLRYSDVLRFYYLADIISTYKLPIVGSEEHALIRNIDRKLQSLGLIGYKRYGAQLGFIDEEEETNKDKVIIYLYGKKFLNFISEKNHIIV